MHLLMVQKVPYLPTLSGAQRSLRLLAEGLAAKGHHCRVVVPAGAEPGTAGRAQLRDALASLGISLSSSPSADVFHCGGVEVHAVAGDNQQLFTELAEQTRLCRPDWTLACEDRTSLCLAAALETSPRHVVYLSHSQATLPFGPECFVKDPVNAGLLRRAAGIVANSDYVKEYIRTWGGLEAFRFYFPAYGPGPFAHLGRFDHGLVTLVNPSAFKGLPIFLELARALPDVAFGAVPTWGTTAADLDALGRLPNVRLLQRRENIDEILARTRVLVAPSLWGEAFGLIVVEAMLRGIPVLASNVGGLPEAKLGVDHVLPVRPITRYDDRLDDRLQPVAVVPEQDVGPWREALEGLLADRRRYERLSSASREAALAFVAGLGFDPLEAYLESLAPAAALTAAPVGAIPQVLDALSPARLQLLARLLHKQHGGPSSPPIPRLPRGNDPDTFPLSFSQERFWLLDQMDPGNAAWNTLASFRVDGPLDAAALERSLNEVVRRHEAWRTTFPVVDGQPVQLVAPALLVPLPVADLQALPQSGRLEATRRLALDEVRRPFDLVQGPLLRALLVRAGDDEHVLLLTLHHIVTDQWSMNVFWRELGTLYLAFVEGRPSPLPDLPIQYADFAQWQRQQLQGDTLARLTSYWKGKLTPPPPALRLPADRPRRAVQSGRGQRQFLDLPAALAGGLQALAQREGVTPFMTLLAALQTLLYRCTGQEDVLVGSPVAGRVRSEAESLIGPFINTLALRTDLSGNPTFRELLTRVRETCLGAYAHQDLPFEKLLGELSLPRDGGQAPLVQVMFIMTNAPTTDSGLLGQPRRSMEIDPGTATSDLTLSVRQQAGGLALRCEYSSDLFEAATIGRLLGHFRTLLEGAVADPGRRLADLPLLTEAERRHLLVEWNDTSRAYPRDACIHHLFESQVRRTPDAVAVEFEGRRLTYRQLNREANRLAADLRTRGVGPDVLVGVCLERSPEMIEAVLAVLKAGGAYLPLDPAHPEERLAFILDDAQAPFLLTQPHLVDSLPPVRAQVLAPASDSTPAGAEWDEIPPAGHPEALAYVIYTSGSTGQPKGVAVAHRPVVNLLTWQARDLPRPARTLQFPALTFDVSVQDIFGTLCTGGTLILIDDEVRRDPAALAEFLTASAVERLYLPSSPLHHLAEAAVTRGTVPQALREVLTVGEQLVITPQVVALFARLPECRLYNQYGPTEAAVIVTSFPLPGRPDEWPPLPPLGRPIANVRLHVLDAHLQPVPVGCPGSLYIGGDCLARGYLNRPELTAQRFIPDPFAAGARLYRTGDLARRLPDGNLEFLGREDFQVKIRGFRVEPGEVEAALNRHPAVRESAVVAREDRPGDKQLVAFLVLKGEPAPSASELRGFLGQALPAYMVPAHFVSADSLPLTPHGKVDRLELQAAEVAWPASGASYRPPQDPVQAYLVEVWEELLGVRPVGIGDDFFELGGHSLLAARMAAVVEQRCGWRFPLAALFSGATVEHLARVLLDQTATWVRGPLVEVQRGDPGRRFFLLHGDLFDAGVYCLHLARHLGRDQPFYALHPHGVSEPSVPSSIEEMAADRLRALQSFQPEGPYLLGGYCNGAVVAFEMAHQLRRQGRQVALLVLIDPPRRVRWEGIPSPDVVRPHSFAFHFGAALTAGPLEADTAAPFPVADLDTAEGRQGLFQVYLRAFRRYPLRPYPGRLVVLQPQENAGHRAAGENPWLSAAAEVEHRFIPGNHQTALRKHAQTLAGVLREYLRKAQEGSRPYKGEAVGRAEKRDPQTFRGGT